MIQSKAIFNFKSIFNRSSSNPSLASKTVLMNHPKQLELYFSDDLDRICRKYVTKNFIKIQKKSFKLVNKL